MLKGGATLSIVIVFLIFLFLFKEAIPFLVQRPVEVVEKGYFKVRTSAGEDAFARIGGLEVDKDGGIRSPAGGLLTSEVEVPEQAAHLRLQPDGTIAARLPGDLSMQPLGHFSLFSVGRDGYVTLPNGATLAPPVQAPGSVDRFVLEDDGELMGVSESREEPRRLAHLRFFRFPNPAGLEPVGGFYFIETKASGEPIEITSHYGFKELASTQWVPTSEMRSRFGLGPLVLGSLLVTVLASLIAVPLGILGAVYISELARALEREFLKPFIELLAGIPSVVLGFFGLVVVAPVVKSVFQLQTGLTAMSGALVLALMALPTIISISEDAIRSVPRAYREASLAVGATNLQTIWRVVVPAALPGITAAMMLGFGRVIGETMAVMMVTGNAAQMTLSPFDAVRTMTATIAAEMGEVPFGSSHYRALFCVGLVLLLATFALNMVAQRALKRYQMR